MGVFVEKNNEIKTLSVNKEFVVDDGQQMLETLKQHQGIEILKENLSMPENQAQSLRERVEQIQREDQERKQALAKKEELERDTDGDGIPDAVERNMGTNPYSPDTDGDGKSDQEEISYGTNPLAADNSKNENLSSSGQQKTVAELIDAKDSKGLAQVLKE